MKESKIAEDMIKDTLSGGLNNVMGYYMDDTVKDKSCHGGHRDVYFWVPELLQSVLGIVEV